MINAVSIVIPTLNEEKYLPRLLQSIAEQDFQGAIQVIVVDGQSTDQTVTVARQFKDRLADLTILQTAPGVAAQRNRGAHLAKYDHLLFMDADVVLPSRLIRYLTEKVNPNERFIDFVLHLPIKPDLLDYLFTSAVFSYLFVAQWLDPLIGGSFIFTTKENHHRIGGFQEDIVLAEDIDYGQRAVADGAIYHLHIHPYIWASPRRLRREGRISLLIKWLRCHYYIKRHGQIYDRTLFSYPMGDHKAED